MSSSTILVFTQNLFFAEPIARVVEKAGGRARIMEDVGALADTLAERPVLVVVEMGRVGEGNWLEAIARVRSRTDDTPILTFGSHVDVAAREAARRAGSDHVWARSRFMREFPAFAAGYLRDALARACCDEPPPERVREALMLFNQGAYYRCHDALEDAWRAEPRACRLLYQGILQLGIALYQAQRGNVRGAETMFGRAARKFVALPDYCQGIDVARLRALTAQWHRQLRELPPDRVPEFPTTPQIAIDLDT